MLKHYRDLEICFTPEALRYSKTKAPHLVVVVDILRATSSICAALQQGAESIIPVASLREARAWKAKNFLIAGERGGEKLPFADFGNSPLEFQSDRVKNKSIVFTTTNGTRAMKKGAKHGTVVLGSFGNLDALSEWMLKRSENVLILCSGREKRFSLEDTAFAGALAKKLMNSGSFQTNDDAVTAALELWEISRKDPISFLKNAMHYKLLEKLGLADSFEFILSRNTSEVIPLLMGDKIIDAGKI